MFETNVDGDNVRGNPLGQGVDFVEAATGTKVHDRYHVPISFLARGLAGTVLVYKIAGALAYDPVFSKAASPASGCLKILEPEVKDCSLQSVALTVLESSRSLFRDEDRSFEDDPFNDAAPMSQRVSAAWKDALKKKFHESSESDSIDYHLKKSPRKTSEHTSPTLTRKTHPSNITNEDTHVDRPCSPSPLLPFEGTRST